MASWHGLMERPHGVTSRRGALAWARSPMPGLHATYNFPFERSKKTMAATTARRMKPKTSPMAFRFPARGAGMEGTVEGKVERSAGGAKLADGAWPGVAAARGASAKASSMTGVSTAVAAKGSASTNGGGVDLDWGTDGAAHESGRRDCSRSMGIGSPMRVGSSS